MPEPKVFARRFKELVAGENQVDVAVKLGYTAGRVSQIMRGERPSREFVERLITAYELPREEWLELGGYSGQSPARAEEDRFADKVAARIAALFNRPPAEEWTADEKRDFYLGEIRRLEEESGEQLGVLTDDQSICDSTPDELRARIAGIREVVLKIRPMRPKATDNERLDRPAGGEVPRRV
jgi:transcriptional regulator with XRE-family HTH domain